jgi:hypothetical protein
VTRRGKSGGVFKYLRMRHRRDYRKKAKSPVDHYVRVPSQFAGTEKDSQTYEVHKQRSARKNLPSGHGPPSMPEVPREATREDRSGRPSQ